MPHKQVHAITNQLYHPQVLGNNWQQRDIGMARAADQYLGVQLPQYQRAAGSDGWESDVLDQTQIEYALHATRNCLWNASEKSTTDSCMISKGRKFTRVKR